MQEEDGEGYYKPYGRVHLNGKFEVIHSSLKGKPVDVVAKCNNK